MGIKLSQLVLDDIVKLYNEGIELKDIAIKHNMHKQSILRIVRRLGIERNRSFKNIINDKADKIIELYKNNVSSEKIAKELDVVGGTVRKLLRKNNIEIKNIHEAHRKHTLVEYFFDVIDTQEKAYILGLFYADGNISKSGNGCKISLKINDEDILIKISNIIYNKKVIYYYNHNNIETATFMVSSNKIKKDLIKHGCTPNKAFDIRLPKLDDNLYQHFIRGYFDGDGCISLSGNRLRVIFTSNNLFISDLENYIKNTLNISCRISGYKNKSKSSDLLIGGQNECNKLLQYMYKDATIYMDRKYNKYQDFLKSNFADTSLKSISIDGTILTSKYLKTLSDAQKEELVPQVFNYFRSKGFPYMVISNDDLIKDFTGLKNQDPNSIKSEYNGKKTLLLNKRDGIDFSKCFSPNIFHASHRNEISIYEAFQDDELLEKVIKNRIDQNYNITSNMIIQGIRNTHSGIPVSIFNPTVAKFIYEIFAPENGIVYDYSFGFGQRLIAALSANKNLTYYGADPWAEAHENACYMRDFINEKILDCDGRVFLNNCGSEAFCPENLYNKIDLAFSSPPYYNTEMYEENASQANSRDYDYFINTYWNKTCSNISKLLKSNGRFILNMSEKCDGFDILDDMLRIAKRYNFIEEDRYFINLSKNQSYQNITEIKLEPIVILRKNEK